MPSGFHVPTQLDIAIGVVGLVLTIAVLIRMPKIDVKRLPISALLILFALYILFGWILAIYNVLWLVWFVVFVASVAVSIVASKDLGMNGLRALALAGIAVIVSFFTRDTTAEIARALALTFGLITAWFWAVGGARYRLEGASLPRSFTLWTLILIGWEGLWLGWLTDTFAVPHIGDWLTQTLFSTF